MLDLLFTQVIVLSTVVSEHIIVPIHNHVHSVKAQGEFSVTCEFTQVTTMHHRGRIL